MGINALAFRTPQHRALFHIDPDCVSITTLTRWSDTRQWMDLVSRSGTSLFVSPQREAIGPEQKAAMKDAFQVVASSTGFAEDWMDDTTPQRWRFRSAGETSQTYQWSSDEGMFPFNV